MYAGARLTVGNAGSYESVLAGERTGANGGWLGAKEWCGSPQDLAMYPF